MSSDSKDMTTDSDDTVGSGDSQPPVNTAAAPPDIPEVRLNLSPNIEHLSDTYDDPQLEFSSLALSSLEKYLPANLLTLNRDEKAKLLSKILRKYISRDEIFYEKTIKEYKKKIMSSYKPRWRGLYDVHPRFYFLPAFRDALKEHTEAGYRRIMSEPSPGIFVFQMFRPDYLERLIEEVDHFNDWAKDTNFQIMKPSFMNGTGSVLADFGLNPMLKKLVEDCIFPVCRVLFNDVCLGKFDSSYGFVVQYLGGDRDPDLGLQVDDSEVTANICLGIHFEGGESYFRGIRCEKHVETDTLPEEIFECPQVAGQVILHRGRHRNGSRETTDGFRANLIVWCRSSFYREQQNYEKGYFNWCGQCVKDLKDKRSQTLDVKRKEMIRIETSKPNVDETQQTA